MCEDSLSVFMGTWSSWISLLVQVAGCPRVAWGADVQQTLNQFSSSHNRMTLAGVPHSVKKKTNKYT